jgi:integrase
MRPMEVLAIKIKDINLRNSLITISPDKQRKNSKTKRVREIQINSHLLPLLREWIKGVTNPEYYVFGSPYEPGKGNKGSSKGRGSDGALHQDYFKPSGTRIKRDTVTKLWKKIVIDKLGIKKYLYACKHSSCDDLLLAGVSIDAIQNQFGHTNKFMTKRYQTVLNKIHRNEINEKSPAFVK